MTAKGKRSLRCVLKKGICRKRLDKHPKRRHDVATGQRRRREAISRNKKKRGCLSTQPLGACTGEITGEDKNHVFIVSEAGAFCKSKIKKGKENARFAKRSL